MKTPKICSRCCYYRKEGQLDLGACQAPRPYWAEQFPMFVDAGQDASDCACFLPGRERQSRLNALDVDRLLQRHRMWGRTATAVKEIILKGTASAAAAKAHGVSRQSVNEMLKKLGARAICPACGNPYFAVSEDSSPADEPVPSAL